MEPNRGASPDSAQTAEPTVTPTPAPADVSSSTTQDNSDLADRAAKVNSPHAMRTLVKDVLEGRVKEKPAAPAETAAAKPAETADPLPPDLQEAAANPPATDAPEGTATVKPEGAEGDTPGDENDETQLGDGPVTAIRSNRPRVQLPQNDEVGRLAIAYQKRNRDWTLSEAIAAAEKQLGVKPAAQTTDTTASISTESQLPQTVDAVSESIKQLRADRKKANAELRFEDASDLSDKLEDLIEHKAKLEQRAERHQSELAKEYDRSFTASETKANELYEFTAQPDSPGAKRMLEIEQDLKDLDDPLYSDPNKPLKIAQMVARELNIAPRRKGAALTPVKPPVVPAQTAKPKNVLPGGESRTAPIVAPAKPAIDTQIEGIKTVADLRKVQKQLGVSLM